MITFCTIFDRSLILFEKLNQQFVLLTLVTLLYFLVIYVNMCQCLFTFTQMLVSSAVVT